MSSGNAKDRTLSFVEATLQKATRDAKHSFYCKLAGNVVISIILIIYTIYAWIYYASYQNQQTIVKFHSAGAMAFPAIVFEMSEFGNLVKLAVNKYSNDCNLGTKSKAKSLSVKVLLNPKTSDLNKYENNWILINSTLSYYGYTDYPYNFSTFNYSNYASYGVSYNLSRRLLTEATSQPYEAENYYYYFQNYTNADYYKGASSNIYILLPPYPQYLVQTNQPSKCGDVIEIHFTTSVPKAAFSKLNLTDSFDLSLYVRAFPDSFGIQYGFDSRKAALSSFTAQNHVFYSGKTGFGERLLENIQLTILRDRINHSKTYYYESASTIDMTNRGDNSSYNISHNVFFENHLYLAMDDFLTNYIAVQAKSWSDTLSEIGGMYITLSSPILLIVGAWLYGVSLGLCEFKAKAPLDPLPEDLLRRLDGYIAEKVLKGELVAGVPKTTSDTKK